MDSPRIGVSPSRLRNRVPTQMRRGIPLYIAFVCIVLLILNADLISLRRGTANKVNFKRQEQQQHKATSAKFRTRRAANSLPQSPPSAEGGSVAGFPKKIWQTWKIDPLNFEERDATTARTWTARNPGYRYEVLTDANDMEYVEAHFGPGGLDRPDIVGLYRAVNATIIKADLLRYMIMYAEGGVYADIDVEALKPVSRFIPERYLREAAEIDMVIGVEIDQPQFREHSILGPKSQSFCQWTFMCKPRLPVMLRLIENIMAWLGDVSRRQGVPVSDVVLDFDEVISGTGPSAFTAAVLAEMAERLGGPVGWDAFHELDESVLVGGFLVLDVEAFCAGQGHSDSGNHNARGALVKHHYHASNWPSRHPRFRHPVYGEVERCNWNEECVRRWDADVAAFALLSPEEQQRVVAERAVFPPDPAPQQQQPLVFPDPAPPAAAPVAAPAAFPAAPPAALVVFPDAPPPPPPPAPAADAPPAFPEQRLFPEPAPNT